MSAFQREAEIRLIRQLFVRTHKGFAAISKDTLRDEIIQGTNISAERFDTAFTSLDGLGYFRSKGDGTETTYCLSPFGIDWVEDYFAFRDTSPTSMNFWPRHEGIIMIGTRRDKYLEKQAEKGISHRLRSAPVEATRWAKWGAILTGFGVVVALVTWWLS